MSRMYREDAGHTVGAAAGCTPEQRRRAARTVAGVARDVEDCALLLAALGLSAAEGLAGTRRRSRKRRSR